MASDVVGEVSMGSFGVTCEVQILTLDRQSAAVSDVMVDTGSEYTWLPEDVLRGAGIPVSKRDLGFVMADGNAITRDVGYAFLRCGEFETVDEVVFGRPDDPLLLGARTLEGFAARVDSRERRLVAAGAIPAAETRPLTARRRPVPGVLGVTSFGPCT
jgi:predicted aspartyl protease